MSSRSQQTSGKPTARRYTPAEKAQAVRLVCQLRAELGTTTGTVKRVAEQLGYGVSVVPIPTLPAIDRIASHSESYVSRCSITIRTARSATRSGTHQAVTVPVVVS